ncbi:MAG: stage II sporulation protein M [Saprospiraceae bacterium]|nr:stage II sporulation protein M [Saprospiraceae bacterium]
MPLILYEAFPAFRISFLVFLVSIFIGAFSTYQNPEFARQIMGDEYMDVTEKNIKKGDPMAIYKAEQQVSMFAMIGINNVRVALFAFAAGLLTSFFTAFILISNGIMVGCFQYYFISKGLGWLSFSTIFLHGALELSCIVICGGAGIVLGNSWLFPGTYSRMTALVEQSKKGIKIMMGDTPVIIIAAMLESFLLRGII